MRKAPGPNPGIFPEDALLTANTSPSSEQSLTPVTIILLCVLWIFVWVGSAVLITGGRKKTPRHTTYKPGHICHDAIQELQEFMNPWVKFKSLFRHSPITSCTKFFNKLPRRMWNFYIEAFLIPSYRPEWNRYSRWSCKSPESKSIEISELRHSVKRKKRKAQKKIEKDKMWPHAIPHDHSQCARIKFNISGTIFETQLRTVNRYPDTILGDPVKRAKYYDPETGTYFFDRMPGSFEAILYFFQSGGYLRRPENIHLDILYSDAVFYELPQNVINKLKIQEGAEEMAQEEHDDMPQNLFQRKIWLLFNYPDSSMQARLLAIISVFVIILSISMFCVETIPEFAHHNKEIGLAHGKVLQTAYIALDMQDPFFFTETICSIWFTFELVVRFASCPSKWEFMKQLLNIIDLVAVFPYFLTIATYHGSDHDHGDNAASSWGLLQVSRLVRVFRILKLSRYSRGLRVLGLTLKSSINELLLVIFFVFLGVIIFSSCLHFAEMAEDGDMPQNSNFRSIPDGFWFAWVTMTTVGYGDVVPKSTWGKIIGSLCAITGVLVIALPVPVIVSNFTHFCHRSIQQQDVIFTQLNHVESCPYRGRGGREDDESEDSSSTDDSDSTSTDSTRTSRV